LGETITQMKITIEAQTDVGRVRQLNEDSFGLVAEQNTVVVCDGMGGHAAGEVASATAAETICDLMREQPDGIGSSIFPQLDSPMPKVGVSLAGAIRMANRRVYNMAARSPHLKGMGTTVVAAVFTDGVVATAHVGDSRAYRIVDGRIEPLTIDHSWIAELVASGQVKPEDAENFADKNVITRALGTRPNVQVDLSVYPTKAGEIYLLCSDGVCGYVSDDDMLQIVTQYQDDLSAAAAGLIAAANAAGGLDNSTVALVRVVEEGDGADKFPTHTVTLSEETDEELQTLDEMLAGRYDDTEAPPKADTGTRKVPTGPIGVQAEEGEEEEVSERGEFRWGLFLTLVAIIIAVGAYFLWPRGGEEVITPENSTPQTLADTPIVESPTTIPERVGVPAVPVVREPVGEPEADVVGGLIYLVAFGEEQSAGVYWDGQYRGRVSDLEMGMTVSTGDHRLVAITRAGDTVMNRMLTVLPNDTLDIEVK